MAKLPPDYIELVMKMTTTQLQKEYKQLVERNEELEESIKSANQRLRELSNEGKQNTQEWRDLKKSIEEARAEIDLNGLKMDYLSRRMNVSSMSVGQLTRRYKEVKKEFENTSKVLDPDKYKRLEAELRKIQGALGRAKDESRGLKSAFFSLQKAEKILTGMFTGIGMAITNQFINKISGAISTITDFVHANSTLAAILGTSRGQIKELTDQARELGRTTSATASEVTQLQTELAKLGFTQQQIHHCNRDNGPCLLC